MMNADTKAHQIATSFIEYAAEAKLATVLQSAIWLADAKIDGKITEESFISYARDMIAVARGARDAFRRSMDSLAESDFNSKHHTESISRFERADIAHEHLCQEFVAFQKAIR